MQWNQFPSDAVPTIMTSIVTISGHGGDTLNAYYSRPTGDGPFPGIVLIHHAPGWDEFYHELTRRYAHHGFMAISHNMFARFGHGLPDDVAAKARGEGGVADAQAIGDAVAAAQFLKSQPYSNGKVGLTGSCSGGRLTFLVACSSTEFSAAAELWGGNVVQANLTAKQPVSPITLTENLSCPLIGIFGNDDMGPSPAQVDLHEEELKKFGKTYEFHRYDGAGHGHWYYHAVAYRPQQAMDGFGKVLTFFEKHLS